MISIHAMEKSKMLSSNGEVKNILIKSILPGQEVHGLATIIHGVNKMMNLRMRHFLTHLFLHSLDGPVLRQ